MILKHIVSITDMIDILDLFRCPPGGRPHYLALCAFHFLALYSTISDTLAVRFVLRDLCRFPLSGVLISDFFMIYYLLCGSLYVNLSIPHI